VEVEINTHRVGTVVPIGPLIGCRQPRVLSLERSRPRQRDHTATGIRSSQTMEPGMLR
jgi:hypothetical protein